MTYLESDRTAWIEVSTAEGGWEAVDVVPEIRDIPPQETDDVTPLRVRKTPFSRPAKTFRPPMSRRHRTSSRGTMTTRPD